jgi:hypothetical protein
MKTGALYGMAFWAVIDTPCDRFYVWLVRGGVKAIISKG